jgi:hypothetical protein
MRDEDERHREAESSRDRSKDRHRTFIARITREVRQRGLPSYRRGDEGTEPRDEDVVADGVPPPPE